MQRTKRDRAIREVVATIEKAWNSHDMKLYASQFREDAHWINIKGMHWRGLKQVMDAHIAFHATTFKNVNFKTDAVETRSLGNGFAVAVVTTTMDPFVTPDGQSLPQTNDRLSYVLVKFRDAWKIVHGQNVVIDPVAAPFDPVNANK